MVKLNRDKLFPWLSLLHAKYMGSGRVRLLIEHFGTIDKVLKASVDNILQVKGFDRKIAESVHEAIQGKFDEEVEGEIRWAEHNGVKILIHSDEEFPTPLRYIPSPPALLYVKGEILPEDVLSVAIVGSRRATDAGRRMANKIANELAEAGITIVSGLAWGIDTSAHKGALKCKSGRTLAVLGNGLRFVYPKEHKLMYKQVSERGALITELFSRVAPDGRNFPPRNRIISGLTLGSLIAEAPSRSGALITAHYALDQGKEVFAIPGAVSNDMAEGNNQLIKECGATLITSAQDILNELEDQITYYRNELAGKISKVDKANIPPPSSKPKKEIILQSTPEQKPETKEEPKPQQEKSTDLSEDEGVILSALTDEPKHIDVICRELQWPISRVSSSMGLLELRGLVEREAGMRFRIL